MYQNIEANQSSNWLRNTVVAGCLGGAALLAGCSTYEGQKEPPTIEEIKANGEFFDMTKPDGTEMECWAYSSRGDGSYGESPSWFSVTCDWDNTAN